MCGLGPKGVWSRPAMTELPKAYDPTHVEGHWYRFWEEQGFFRASDDPADDRPTYTVAIPPPNVTGSLHMGHACRATFEDVLVRHKRMQGYNTLWVPGTDHAGIATQVVVERQLAREGKTRHELGREAFVERVWKWREESGGRILRQLRDMGASCDWSRERFTMDAALSRAVREAFVRLYEEGLIYRGTRLVNWDVASQTVLSDLEVEAEEGYEGELFDFAYPVEGGGEVVVSTTRPETMLGDTAVAVHPEDERYRALHGKFVLHPFVDRRIPVICDPELVDPEFGTGVVKVTPAHDPNDFATGKRHELEEINILELDGTLNDQGGPFAGMERFAAREAVKQALTEKGLARGSKKHLMTRPISQRSGTVVEPLISTQWFVKMEPLAKPAIEKVEDGTIQIIPEDWTKTYFHWMRNIQDWCISRQLWWGHPIPAFYCGDCGEVIVSREDPRDCPNCTSTNITPDPDVLDTWFSSSLWPFSTLGWPEETADLRRFYPTQDMETGYDILFFWVARMIMMGLHFMGDVPFTRVLLAGMVTDERGDKMSKVKGNVIDPLDVISGASPDALIAKAEKAGAKPAGIKYLRKTYPDGFAAYGADALRMTLLSYSPQTRRIALSIKRIEGYRNFSNKLWNASRFALMNLDETSAKATGEAPPASALANRWILSRLHVALAESARGLDEYRLDEASQALYHFVWGEFCDVYLEDIKPLIHDEADPAIRDETLEVLAHTLETTLRALHPMMPFITEEIWQRVPRTTSGPTVMLERYPEASRDGRHDPEAEEQTRYALDARNALNTIRAGYDLNRRTTVSAVIRTGDPKVRAVLESVATSIEAAARATLTFDEPLEEVPPFTAVSLAASGLFRVDVPLEGLIDRAKETERLGRELKKVDKDLAQVAKKLGNAKFVEKAPAEVVATERKRLDTLRDKKRELEAAISHVAPPD